MEEDGYFAPRRLHYVGLCLILACAALCIQVPMTAEAKTSDMITVRTQAGMVQGKQVEKGIHVFKGIPYAQPPVGELRWEPPRPPKAWDGVRPAVDFAPASPQPDVSEITWRKYENTSEDCLYLNVWTPAKQPGDRLPVMVWIHGGAFIVGSASDDYYDGQDLAKQGVVVVTANYRLGPFGFLAHPLLSKKSQHNASGNYGMLDQIAVLEWVRDNIAAFGGDPGRVTIFGESAGGRSVAHLMVSPLSKGLFHRAIIQSSSVYRPIYHLRESWYGRPSMESVGERVAEALGCKGSPDPIKCMRAKSTKEIMNAAKPALAGMDESRSEGTPFEPVVDGWSIPADPSDMFDQGKQHPVNLIAGTNADEGALFIKRLPLSLKKIKNIVAETFPENSQAVLDLYPFKDRGEAHEALNKMSGDMSSTMPVRSTVRNMTKIGAKSWMYYFTRVRPDSLGRKLGAYHGSEIRFVFNSLDRGKSLVVDADRKLSDVMSRYWVRFAETGDPNGAGLAKWPQFARDDEAYMELGDEVRAKTGLRKTTLDLMEKIEAERRSKRKSNR